MEVLAILWELGQSIYMKAKRILTFEFMARPSLGP